MIDYKNLLAYPIIEELEYREKIDPVKLNTILRSLEESVLRAIMRASDAEEKYNSLISSVVASYEAMANKVNQSYGEINSLFTTCYDDVLIKDNPIRLNKSAGIVTLDWESGRNFSKVPIHEGILSPAVKIYIDGAERDMEDDVYNILKPGSNSYWMESTTSGEHTIEIQLPPSLNKKINFVEVVPFPVFGVYVKKIICLDQHSDEISIYDSSNEERCKFYNNSCPMSFHFNPITYNNTIKIVVEPFETSTDGYVMGFSNINMSYIDYINTGVFYMPFQNIPSDDPVIGINMRTLNLDYYIDPVLDIPHPELIRLSIVHDLDDGQEIVIPSINNTGIDLGNNSINIENGQLYLKVTMLEKNYTTPMIRGANLIYDRIL